MNIKTMQRIVALAWAVAAFIAAPAAFAQNAQTQTQNVDIGGATLTLGTSRANAMGEANANFEIYPTGTKGQYNLYPKPTVRKSPAGQPQAAPATPNAQRDQPRAAIGAITIANDKLVSVTRYLGSFHTADGQAAIHNMIGAFAKAPGGGTSPSVHAKAWGYPKDSPQAGAHVSQINFRYPDRRIQVSVYQSADQSELATVTIDEQYALNYGEASGKSQ